MMADKIEEPRFMAIQNSEQDYLRTIEQARSTLDEFKAKLGDLPGDAFACVKFFIPQSQGASEGANIWLTAPFFEDGFCCAKPFELPAEFTWIQVGQWLKFDEMDLMDWYILTGSGELTGGYSLRYQRSLRPEDKKSEFDAHIGVTRYL